MAVEKTRYGTWRARWRDGSGKQRAQTFTRKIDALQHLAKVRADLAAGTYTDPRAGDVTVRAWADLWLAGAMNLAGGSIDAYRRDLDRHILPILGDHRLRQVTKDRIDDYLSTKLAAGYAPSTVVRHHRTIHRMLAVAVASGKLQVNPAAQVTPPVVDPSEMRFLTADQVQALASSIGDRRPGAAADAQRYQAWVEVAAYGGLRWSELVGLRRSAVDGPRIAVREQLVRRDSGAWERTRPKSKAGRRIVTLPPSVAELLAAHVDRYALAGPDGLVFPNRAGRPLNGPSFRGNVFKPALARAGLDGAFRVHDLRHTAVALAIAAGAHPKAIQARMGHASISITLDRYGHLYPEMDGDIAGALDAIRTGRP